MKKKILAITISCILGVISMTGCGSSSTNTAASVTKDKDSYISALEDGVYYVRDKENNCTPVYFGNATFDEGSTPSTPDNERVLWYKTDFEQVPTLYKGDSLIMFTKSEIEERMSFERFEYFGYTIGICGMEELKSGRYKIFTDPDKKCTYPNGDTDELLKLDNESVILESIGGEEVRATMEEDSPDRFLTRCGTIKGLKESQVYQVDIYEGTVYHDYTFKADVIALGSMEVTRTYNYKFETENLINITIPEFFNSGYYMINGVGLFRYVNGDSYSSSTEFNTANVDPGDEGTETITQADLNSNSNEVVLDPALAAERVTTFNVTSPGNVTIVVSFSLPGNYGNGDGLEDVTAVIDTPSGGTLMMVNADDGTCLRSFQAEVGTYTIRYYNLDIRVPHLSVQ